MYICICKGITEKHIEDAITTRNSGHPKEVLKALGVGSDCGSCVEEAVLRVLEQNGKSHHRKTEHSNNS
jgi:bacterioferritin-associated ferredoxin